MNTHPSQKISSALARLALGVLEAAEAAEPTGAPGGVLYSAMQAHGATLNQFQSFMGTLVRPGYLELDGECYRITSAGGALKTKLAAIIGGIHDAST